MASFLPSAGGVPVAPDARPEPLIAGVPQAFDHPNDRAEFETEIPDEEAEKITTVQAAIDYVTSHQA